MNIIEELKEVLALTKTIYTNNFVGSKGAYTYFKDNKLWSSNTTNEGIAEEEMIILHTFKNQLPFDNIGIPSKELHGVVDSITEDSTFTQKEDHIIIVNGKTKVTLPIVEYENPPSINLEGLTYVPVPSMDLERIEKRLLQFVYKTDENGGKVHFMGDAFSTDINSIHTENIGAGFPYDFAVPLSVYSMMKYFAHLAVDDYLYMKTFNGTVLITKCHPVMDISFIQEMHENVRTGEQEVYPIVIPEFDATNLFKLFGMNTKKPDREVVVDINKERIEISTGDDLTGFVSVDLDSHVDNPAVKFKVGTEKLFDLMKNYDKVYLVEIAGEKALWGKIDETTDKYVVIEEV